MRLIDADALDSVVHRLNTEEHAQITRLEYKLVDSVIFEFPTIDAVPVTRCKDCKYCSVDRHEAPTIDAVPVVRCRDCVNFERDDAEGIEDWCAINGARTREDGYCAWGERKEYEED